MMHRKVLPVKPEVLDCFQTEAWVIHERERETDIQRQTQRQRHT